MKLLVVGYVHSEGGMKYFSLGLARGMAERGHDVTVATPGPFAGQPWNLPEDRTFRVVNVDRLSQVLHNYPGGDAAFDCAIIMGTGWKSMVGLLLNRRIGKRIFFEGMGGDRGKLVDPRLLVHLGFDGIVGQAPSVEAKFRKNFHWNGPSAAIPAIPHALERVGDITRPTPRTPKRGELKACYFSRFVEHKGAHWLLEQWDTLSQDVATLDLWGAGPDEDRIRATIAQKNLGDRVRIHGRYSGNAAYIAQLQSYDLELLPTRGLEGAPLVLLEAMACGLPFVANGVDGIPIYDNSDCRITDGNIANFLPAVRSMADALYAGEIDFARLQQHYIDHFSFNALCDRWERFLLDVVRT